VTPLHWLRGITERGYVTALVRAGADPNATDDTGEAPLHAAAFRDDVVGIEELLAAGAKIDSRDRDGGTPLYFAAAFDRHRAAKALLAAGADPTLRAANGDTPEAAARKDGAWRMVWRLWRRR
jgi:ankyrin repeat protein